MKLQYDEKTGFLVGDGKDREWVGNIDYLAQIAKDVRLIRAFLKRHLQDKSIYKAHDIAGSKAVKTVLPRLNRLNSTGTRPPSASNDHSISVSPSSSSNQTINTTTHNYKQVIGGKDTKAITPNIVSLPSEKNQPVNSRINKPKEIAGKRSKKDQVKTVVPKPQIGAETQHSSKGKEPSSKHKTVTPSSAHPNRDSSGRFIAKQEQQPIISAISDMSDRLSMSMAGDGEDIDPTITATKELTAPLRTITPMLGMLGSKNKEGKISRGEAAWYKKLYRKLRYSGKDSNDWNRKQYERLRAIEEGQKGSGGSNLILAALMTMIGLMGKVLSGVLGIAKKAAFLRAIARMLPSLLGRRSKTINNTTNNQNDGCDIDIDRKKDRKKGSKTSKSSRTVPIPTGKGQDQNKKPTPNTTTSVGTRSQPEDKEPASKKEQSTRDSKVASSSHKTKLPKVPRGIPAVSTILATGAGLFAIEQIANDSSLTDDEKTVEYSKTGGSLAGGVGGALAGASAGAAVGSIVPVIGTAIGGAVGAAIGGYFGGNWGEVVGAEVGQFFTSERWDELKTSLSKSWDDMAKTASNWITEQLGFDPIEEGKEAWEATKNKASELKGKVSNSVSNGLTYVSDGFKSLTGLSPTEAVNRAKSVISDTVDSTTETLEQANEYVKQKTNIDIKQSVTEGIAATTEFASEIKTKATDSISSFASSANDKVENAIGINIEESTKQIAHNAAELLQTAKAGLFSLFGGELPSNKEPNSSLEELKQSKAVRQEALQPVASSNNLPDLVRNTRIKDSSGRTRTLNEMGVKTYADLERSGGQAFEGGYNNPETLYATSLIQQGLGKHFNRITAQNDLYHQKRDKNKSRKSAHTQGYKTDFTVKGISYAEAHKRTANILAKHGLSEGEDFKIISTPHGTGDHIDFKLNESGQKKIRGIMQPSGTPKQQIQRSAQRNKVNKKTSSHWEDAKYDIVNAANQVGVDAGTLAAIAHFESGFNPNAQPIAKGKRSHLNKVRQFDGTMAISSAHGYGQFINDTWKGMLNKHGAKYGVKGAGHLTTQQANRYRQDKKLQAAMLAEYTKENVTLGRKLGGKNDIANVYALHNLGSGTGGKFLKALKNNPNAKVNSVLSRDVIAGNSSLYGKGNITVTEAYARMAKKMQEGGHYSAEAKVLQNKPSKPASNKQQTIHAGYPAMTGNKSIVVKGNTPLSTKATTVASTNTQTRASVETPISIQQQANKPVKDHKPSHQPMPPMAGRDLPDRQLAHIATGGISSAGLGRL